MSQMVERVARAMWINDVGAEANWDDQNAPEFAELYRSRARAAIAAMGQSTKPMDDKGFAKLKEVGAYPIPNKPKGRGCDLWAEDMADVWRAMIDEALK